jgi:hypothetical protein
MASHDDNFPARLCISWADPRKSPWRPPGCPRGTPGVFPRGNHRGMFQGDPPGGSPRGSSLGGPTKGMYPRGIPQGDPSVGCPMGCPMGSPGESPRGVPPGDLPGGPPSTPITFISFPIVNNRSALGQKHGHRGKSSFFHQIIFRKVKIKSQRKSNITLLGRGVLGCCSRGSPVGVLLGDFVGARAERLPSIGTIICVLRVDPQSTP